MRSWRSFSCLWLCIVLVYLTTLVTCYDDYVSKYYSGRPDPIGIDFASTYATAVYADSESNFSSLGIAMGVYGNGNTYAQYIEALYRQAMSLESPSLIIDDSPQSDPDVWYERAKKEFTFWYLQVRRSACRTLRPLLETTKTFHKVCCPSSAGNFQLPRSQYRHLISQYERAMQLKRLVPKYFRPSTTQKPFSRSEFVFLIYQLLLDLKSQAQKLHGVSIMSAEICVPPWVPYDLRNLFEEAAFLADIGTFYSPFDKPYSRVEMAARAALPSSRQLDRSVMVLDHGGYHFSAHHFVMNEWNAPIERFSSQASIYGSYWIWEKLGTRLIEGFNSNVTEEEKIPRGATPFNELSKIVVAMQQIKNNTNWPDDLEFASRSKRVNLTELSGRTRFFNMTGADVQEINKQYTAIVIDIVQHLLLRHDIMTKYLQARPKSENIQELSNYDRWKLSLDIAATVPPPSEIGSWFHSVDEIIILDDGWEIELLDEAVRNALSWEGAVGKKEKETCIPTTEIAARGAALRAMQLIGSYEERQEDMEMMREIQDANFKMQGGN